MFLGYEKSISLAPSFNVTSTMIFADKTSHKNIITPNVYEIKEKIVIKEENIKEKDDNIIYTVEEENPLLRYVKEDILAQGGSYIQVEKLEEVIGTLDVLYMTRVQRERFFNEEDYVRLKDTYILDEDKMALGKEDLVVMHPLPRVNEISVKVDKDPRACYFKQVLNGKYMRMALILKLLGVKA